MVDKHTYTRLFKNNRVTSKWLANKLVDRVKEQPNIKVNTIQEKIQREYVVKISRSKTYRAKQKAVDMVEGNHAEQYGKLWDYCCELLWDNTGSSVKLSVGAYDCVVKGEEHPRSSLVFERLYICFDG